MKSTEETRELNSTDKVNDITDVIGKCGPWQRKLIILQYLLSMPGTWSNLSITVLAPKVDFWCSRPSKCANVTTDEWKKYGLPVDYRNGMKTYSQCKMFETMHDYMDRNDTTPEVIDCDSWEYDLGIYHSTIVEKWNLVCDKSWLISLGQTLYFAGFLVSMFVWGQSADRFGRRPVILICNFGLWISCLVCMFSPNYSVFAASRFFMAFFRGGSFIVGYVLVMESVGTEHRTTVGLAQKYGWATGYVLLPGIAWVVRDWFYIQLIFTLFFFFLLILYWMMVPESLRWLLTADRLDEATSVATKCLKENGREVDDLKTSLLLLSEKTRKEGEKDKRKKTFIDLFKTPYLRKSTLILYFAWFSNSFGFYGLSLNANEIGGHPLLYLLFSGIVEFPSATLAIFLIKRIGRRRPQIGFLVSSGVVCFLAIAVPSDFIGLRIAFAVIAKFCVTASFCIVYIFSSEIFATVVRNVGIGTSSMCGRISTLLVPFLKEIGQMVHPGLPLGLLGTFSITSGLLVLLLPETRYSPLPDMIGQTVIDESRNYEKTCKRQIVPLEQYQELTKDEDNV